MWAEGLNRPFTKEDLLMVNREMKIKITIRYYQKLLECLKLKTYNKRWKRSEGIVTLIYC